MTRERHVTKVRYLDNHCWMTSTNLHPYDNEHRDTVCWWITQVKPTPRQIRKHRLMALRHKRHPSRRNYTPPITSYS